MGKMIKKIRCYEGTSIPAVGASGGICTLWKSGKWETVQQLKDQHWIKIDIKNKITRSILHHKCLCSKSLQRQGSMLEYFKK